MFSALKCSSCLISVVFIFSMFYSMLTLNKRTVMKTFMTSLAPHELTRYERIVQERQRIYFTGFGIGVLVSLFVLYVLPLWKGNRNGNDLMKMVSKMSFRLKNMHSIGRMCFASSTTFLTTYYYYILAKKSDYLILHLDDKAKRKAWLKVYKTMQSNCHTGFALGIVGVAFLSLSL